MRYAILIDAGYFHKKAKRLIQVYNRQIIENLIRHVQQVIFENDSLYRIFYYDAAPSDAVITNPLDNTVMNFGTTPTFKDNTALLEDIKNIPMLALRLGKISAQKNSWEIKNIKAIKPGQALKPKQITPKISQKGVDMKIGLDIATIALKKLADKIILIAGDIDFVPAIKFARSEGIQVFITTLTNYCPPSLIEHTDEVINVDLTKIKNLMN